MNHPMKHANFEHSGYDIAFNSIYCGSSLILDYERNIDRTKFNLEWPFTI